MSLPARVTRCCPTSRYRSPTMNVPDLVSGKSPDIWFIGLSRRPSQDGLGGFGLDVKKEPFGICVCFRAEYRERAGRFRLLPCPISSFPCRPDETAGLGFLHHRLRPTLTAVRTKGEREQGCSKSRQAVIRQSPFRAKGRLPQHRPPCTLLRESAQACHARTYTVAVRTARLTSPWAPRAAADAIRRMDSGSTHQRIYDRARGARGRSFDSLGVTGKYVFARPRHRRSPAMRG
jgi:hypothetical protein